MKIADNLLGSTHTPGWDMQAHLLNVNHLLEAADLVAVCQQPHWVAEGTKTPHWHSWELSAQWPGTLSHTLSHVGGKG